MRIPIAGILCLVFGNAVADVAVCIPEPGRDALWLTGEIAAGESYAAPAGPGWILALEPDAHGWIIRLRDPGGADLARITPPFHFVPNPRDLHGWHFRNRANTRRNEGDVNAPQEHRDFIFHREIDPNQSDADRVAAAQGRGTLEITDFALSPPQLGTRARFTRLEFAACLTWPAAWGE